MSDDPSSWCARCRDDKRRWAWARVEATGVWPCYEGINPTLLGEHLNLLFEEFDDEV